MSKKDQIIAALSGKRVGIIGDVMLDRYIVGRVDRMSPEAPVPVLVQEQTQSRLGGAANVALNIHSLGSYPIVCSIVGNDRAGEELTSLFDELGNQDHYLVKSNERQTTVKTRLLGNSQHLLRLDNESQNHLSDAENNLLKSQIDKMFEHEEMDVVILQDYNKGLLNEELIHSIIERCAQKDIFVAVDPKYDNFFAYNHANLFKPNLKETSQALGRSILPSFDEIQQASVELMTRMNTSFNIITLSDKGIFIHRRDTEGILIPVQKSEIVDVCGAGDAVLSVSALMLQAGLGEELVAHVANSAGRIVCQKIGVAPVTLDELMKDV